MKVSELIELLKLQNQDLDVYIAGDHAIHIADGVKVDWCNEDIILIESSSI